MDTTRTIYLAGGCFWGIDLLMTKMPGVIATTCGYANGDPSLQESLTYEEVCSGTTGYRETVKVDYDPAQVSLDRLLHGFYAVIDPTLLDRQGNDRGSQYQAGIYWIPGDTASEAKARAVSALEARRLGATPAQINAMEEGADPRTMEGCPLRVELAPLAVFVAAEDYHQDYLEKNPGGYCHVPFQLIQALTGSTVDPGDYTRPTDEELRRRLTDEQWHITQEEGTEAPFANEFWDFDQPGIYVDITTGEPLFTSADKYPSSCGWPAFSAPIDADVVRGRQDTSHGMVRTEVRSRVGDAHLGHVFPGDAESPTGTRFCIDSAALRFIPEAAMAEEGYGDYLDRL